jgi:hypothetical protein
MVSIFTGFSPDKHGFRFTNQFETSFEYQLPIIGKVKLGEIFYGLCGGMCCAALDYYYAGRPVPEYTREEEFTISFYRYLHNRQLDSMKLPLIPKIIEWMLRDDQEVIELTVQREIPKIRRSLDKGDPAVLAQVRVRGTSNPTANHQVLATGYDINAETNDITFTIYDPNYPGQQPTLSINLSKSSADNPLKSSTGDVIRGIFVIKYNREIPPER